MSIDCFDNFSFIEVKVNFLVAFAIIIWTNGVVAIATKFFPNFTR